MRLFRSAAAAVASCAWTAVVVIPALFDPVHASSVARNPLTALEVLRNPTIHTFKNRVTALSEFDLSFELFRDQRVRLALEPNHDIIAEGATIEYLGADGQVTRRETIDRLEHKVYKGRAWVKRGEDRWVDKGWARITIRRDGIHPLFEGVFSIDHNHHHVQMTSSYTATKHVLDPAVEPSDDEYMVVWRDSDISETSYDHERQELRRDLGSELACHSDRLEFNMNLDHPVYGRMLKREEGFWSTPISSLFSKRQLDSTPGSGNSAGVNLASTIGSTAGCPTSRKVALVGVATDCTYTATFNSTESARANVISVMNSASDLYESTFNITLGLQNLTVSEATCPGTPPQSNPWNQGCSDSVTIQDRLNLFSEWRGAREDTNSHWTLLTNCPTGQAVGLAWLGQACVQGSMSENSTSGSGSETVASANVVARTNTEWQVIAHETGHTFGAVHDCTSSTCADSNTVSSQQCCPLSSSTCDAGEQFIMNPSTASGITKFSACSIGNICSAMGRNSVKSNCLTNNRGVTTISGQQCGNGIVEEGEDCDCGGAESCGDNPCCNPTTCKFQNGAVCDDSNEDCCNNCQFAPATTVCRASTGDCDKEETCTGNSPYCPDDEHLTDGSSCGDGLKCASGQCTSRNQQCQSALGAYTSGSNDTYACDSNTCVISCASPEFPNGVCYSLQQNFLDGTECGGGGHCSNGRCTGSDVGKEIGNWISRNKGIVIGVAVAVGVLLLISIFGCISRSCRRRRMRARAKAAAAAGPPAWPGANNGRGMGMGGPPPPRVPPPWAPNRGMSESQQPFMSPHPHQGGGGWYGPPPPAYSGPAVRYA
ncbi:Disintegrin and metalloproteinase domain-containing protein B [Lasiodiplodia hormozganensis]|uniref:Disintegrin and metalloproteinase domain-containing protein B n=1 Tax=Lasiodiplodia hormozganensis TaxID=869390 RepID=A0AA39XTK1_9PEZI|nr:Disintegrin and metalloproteinase domain-containing protein B [Lasiodiplodia hormozganensis]